MDLAQLYKKNDQDKENFGALRDKVWSDLKKRHEQIIAAFQSEEALPEYLKKQFQLDIANYTKEWAIPHGNRYKNVEWQYENQVKSSGITHERNSAVNHYISNLASTRTANRNDQLEKDSEKLKHFLENKKAIDFDKEGPA
jgi:hypothetical protein